MVDNFTTVRLIFENGQQVVIEEPIDVFDFYACESTAPGASDPVSDIQGDRREVQAFIGAGQSPVEQVHSIGMPSSEGYRFVLWLSALSQWRHEKLLGYGQSNEQTVLGLSCTGLPHSHNQLLSWLVSGG